MTARSIMSGNPTCCTSGSTIRDAAQMMVECDCGAIPVVSDLDRRQVIGMITDRDIACRAVAQGLDPNSTFVADCMTTEVSSVGPDDSVGDILQTMQGRQIRRIPVVDAGGALIGMVSQADIALGVAGREAADLVEDVSKPYLG